MSFVRVNRRPLRTKKSSVPKKEWVSTVNDLSVHKATPEEVSKRHEMHRSRNRVVAQWELREKAFKRSQPASPTGLHQTRLRLIKEVFSDQCQLQDVLMRSDRAMAVVKDLFGDAPRRQTGFPSVTMVPDCESDSELPVLLKPDPPTQLSLLSQSMMDQQALNESEGSVLEPVDDDETSLNLNSEACRLKRKTCKPKHPVWRTDQQHQQQNPTQTGTDPEGSRDQSALNATMAVQHLKARQGQSDLGQSSTLVTQVLNAEALPHQSDGKSKVPRTTRGRSVDATRLDGSGLSSQSTNLSSLDLLQDMLGQVETELHYLEQKGPLGSPEQPELHRGLTGFSVALVTALGRIARHLRRREEEVQKEEQGRRRLEEELREQKGLINALTAECFALRQESAALQAGLQEQITEQEQRLDMVILALGGLENEPAERLFKPEEGAVMGADLNPVSAKRDLQERASVSPAVLLSPPRQRDTRAPPAACSRSLHFEGSSSAADLCSTEESDTSCTPPSFINLPLNVLPRPALLEDQPSHNAMLEQIAELTRQNAVMRGQRDQPLPSTGAPASSEKSTDRLSAVTTVDRQASPPTDPKPIQQCLGVGGSSVKLMEERLQELTRQSSAARSKLLELIEQQRRATVLSTSPTLSPIPHSSSAPPTGAGSASVSERGHPPHAGGMNRRSAVSTLSVEGDEMQAINIKESALLEEQ
ncbi:spindle and centriole-associated protein 1 isoform X2 [Brachyhypopomus gauderio]|uniref:spindle and centriole-associated protein 1 isoform X2 n=1 Tax=Brachyhypopomus gauderio TaxID=698409 RepID=UPI00404345AB